MRALAALRYELRYLGTWRPIPVIMGHSNQRGKRREAQGEIPARVCGTSLCKSELPLARRCRSGRFIRRRLFHLLDVRALDGERGLVAPVRAQRNEQHDQRQRAAYTA